MSYPPGSSLRRWQLGAPHASAEEPAHSARDPTMMISKFAISGSVK